MRNVRKIEQTSPVLPKRKRVAAYARVSTDTERLNHSLSAQVSYYSDLIQRNPEWEYVGVYADNGITGTKLSGRPEFERLLQNCEDGKIDIILTKSISRFSRNTVDLLAVVRRLKELGIEIQFEKEHMLLQKEYIEDPITKHRRKNRGELPQYFVEDTHEAIIDPSVFEFVQDEIARRKELGPLANKSLNTCCFTGRIKCSKCGKSFVHTQRRNRAKFSSTYELGGKYGAWTCNSRKGKNGCGMKDIPERVLESVCADVLGLDDFSEDAFTEKIERITVHENCLLIFHFYDGREESRTWHSTAKKDCWGEEQKDLQREWMRNYMAKGEGRFTVFTTRIKCGCCGSSCRRQTRKLKNGSTAYWTCSRTGQPKCGINGVRESDLQEILTALLGTEEFDSELFREQVKQITMHPGGKLDIILADGHTEHAEYSTKRHGQPWTAEQRARFSESAKMAYPPERRQAMSEKMKQIRKERGSNWVRK